MFETASKEDWVVIAALASPHILYAFIWFNSDTWRKWFGKSSVEKFETAAWLLKGGWLERFRKARSSGAAIPRRCAGALRTLTPANLLKYSGPVQLGDLLVSGQEARGPRPLAHFSPGCGRRGGAHDSGPGAQGGRRGWGVNGVCHRQRQSPHAVVD